MCVSDRPELSAFLWELDRCREFEPRLLKHAYPLASAGTCADGSQLATELINVRVRCRACRVESDAAANRLLCGACGDWRTDLLSGDELMLLRVELETQEDAMELANV